jgi:thiol-disulfide isomerase/thioredoxin
MRSTSKSVSKELLNLLSESSKPAVVKFYADWCVTCKDYAPAFSAVRQEMSGSVDFLEIDADDNKYKALLKELQISRIPETVLVSRSREQILRKLGPLSREELREAVNQIKNLSDK